MHVLRPLSQALLLRPLQQQLRLRLLGSRRWQQRLRSKQCVEAQEQKGLSALVSRLQYCALMSYLVYIKVSQLSLSRRLMEDSGYAMAMGVHWHIAQCMSVNEAVHMTP